MKGSEQQIFSGYLYPFNLLKRKLPPATTGKRRTTPEDGFSRYPAPSAPHRLERLLAVHVAGDSMIEAHIYDGDIAIFHPGITEGNGIFVVSVGNTLVVKRIDRDPASHTIVLYSANPAYAPRRFSEAGSREH